MSTRIQKIKDTYSIQFNERLKQEKVDISLDSAWDILISSDPGKNKKNVRWLVETYINKGYLWEDIASGPTSKVAETLTEFDKHKRNLEPDKRSLTKYQTLGALWSAIKPYVGQLTSGEEKKSERDKAYNEAEVIIDRDDGFKIVVPKTEYSAKWFGRGTRWCTAAEKNNMFEDYASQSPLFIIFMPDGDKLQLWKYEHDIQFMDENDDDISIDYIEENWNTLEPICRWMKNLDYIPEEARDYDICMKAVKQKGSALQHVPEKLKDYEICMEAVKTNGHMLQYIPKELMDKEICMVAVKNGNALACIPEAILDKPICLEAVKQDGWALAHVPIELKDREICLKAVKQNGRALQYIPKELMDYKMCLEAVKQDGWALEYVPIELKDREMCMHAIKNNGNALVYTPKEFRDYETCMEAMKQNGEALEYVPKELRDKKMCMVAIKNNGWAMSYIPEKLRDTCMTVIQNYDCDSNTGFKEDVVRKNINREMINEVKKIFDNSITPSPTI